jgi:glycosyltransferase involved in cell wall biosynthesis
VATIRNSIDFDRRFAALSETLPVELAGQEYLIYFGRLEERKGVHILGQALPSVLERHPRLHAVFVGDNVLTYRGMTLQAFVEQCNRRYRDRLHFFPRLPQRHLYPLVKHAQIAVLPSLWEGLGNVSLEALDAGTPVIATLGCGFGEIIEDGKSGLLVPPADVPALGAALLSLLADRDRLAGMGAAARERAKLFHPERMMRELVAYYERVLGVAPPKTEVAPDAA